MSHNIQAWVVFFQPLFLLFFVGFTDAECDPPCSTETSIQQEFCGRDDKCHSYSCQNWYQYGPKKFTTYKDQARPELVCKDIADDDIDTHQYLGKAGILYGCNQLAKLKQSFTKECIAPLDSNTTFTCHEMSFNTNFASFIAKVNDTNITCGDLEPKYFYLNWIGYETTLFGGEDFRTLAFSSTFNQTMAYKTIYSELVSNETFKTVPNNTSDDNPDDDNSSSIIELRLSTFLWTSILVLASTLL